MKMKTIGQTFGMLIMGMELAVFAADPSPVVSPVLANPATDPTNAVGKPKIQFATPIYDFGKMKVGEPVKWEFVFTNTGTALLEITGVQPGCGCTTAGEWTRKVEPGKT